jgi:hypothetical protein
MGVQSHVLGSANAAASQVEKQESRQQPAFVLDAVQTVDPCALPATTDSVT